MKNKINKLKNILYGLLVGSLVFVSCKKEDLQKDPTSRIAPNIVFATVENAYAAINGMHKLMYAQWYSNQAAGGQSGNMLYMDVLGEDFVMTANANGFFIADYKWQRHRDPVRDILTFNYGFYYAFIGNANEIIANIDNVIGAEEDKNLIKGEAYAYRAWAYYQMVQLFGKRYVSGGDNSSLGMSLVLEKTVGAVPRNSVEEVYTQINSDLDEAIRLFGIGKVRPNKSHLNVNIAKGIKARVLLTQENFPQAAQLAREARDGFALMTGNQYINSFVGIANPEWMWAIEHREDQTTFFYGFYAYVGNFSSTNTRGNPKAINSLLYDKISATDIRKRLWDPTGSDATFPLAANGVRMPYMTRKFTLENPGSSNGDLMFMRSAEMYLIEAESLAKIGGRDVDARKVLYDLISTRDASYVLSTNSGAALVEEILVHRRIELWGEGFRFYDLKRLNLPLDRNGANHIGSLAVTMSVPAGDIQWEFLIPQGEIDRTLGVVQQNPL